MTDEEKKEEQQTEEVADEVVDPSEHKDHYSIPWRGFIIVFGVIFTLIVVCVIVILCNGGFYQW